MAATKLMRQLLLLINTTISGYIVYMLAVLQPMHPLAVVQPLVVATGALKNLNLLTLRLRKQNVAIHICDMPSDLWLVLIHCYVQTY